MAKKRVIKFDVAAEAERYFDDSSLTGDEQPRMVVLTGGVACGKTTIRKRQYTRGYVLLDAADIFLNLSRGEYFAFPGPLAQALDLVGSTIASRAIAERRHIVTEIIGAQPGFREALLDLIRAVGYRSEFVFIDCDPQVAWQRNVNRGDDCISAHFSEQYHLEWLRLAAAEMRS